MQPLEIISVNLWQTIISLCNLLLLFLILKRFLYKPVKAAIKKREDALAQKFEEAKVAEESAKRDQSLWEEKLKTADDEAENIRRKAVVSATQKSDEIISYAKSQAAEIVEQGKIDAELEQKKAEESIKQEIVVLSSALTEKMLSREINEDDHRELINEFLEEIGDKS